MVLKEIISNSKLSPLQLAKGIKSLKSITESQAQFEAFKMEIIPEERLNRITRIIAGLEQEDEFAILCHLMGTCESLVGIDQTPVIANENEKPPDFLATFSLPCRVQNKSKTLQNLTYKCFIEVKSSRKATYKISKKDFRQRVSFAKRYNLPLVFAVRLLSNDEAALWVVVESEYLESRKLKLDITAFNKGIRHLIFDEYLLMPIPNLHIIHYYDSTNKEPGIKHQSYGTQIKTVLLFRDFQYEVPADYSFLSVIFDAFRPEEVQTKTYGHFTAQILRLGLQARSICDILYVANRMAMNEHGDRPFDPSRLTSRFDSQDRGPILFTREMMEYLTSMEINSKPLFFLIGFEDPSQHLARLNRLCSNKQLAGQESQDS